MSENGLKSIKATAEEFGVRRETITDFVEMLGIETKGMSNGKARGIDAKDRKLIAERLRRPPARRRTQTAGA